MKSAATALPTSQVKTLGATAFRKPLANPSAATNKAVQACGMACMQQAFKPTWQYDPHAPGAIVLNHSQWSQAGPESTSQVVPVVVDPHIARKLRPHQSQGVQFLYECVLGLREASRYSQTSKALCQIIVRPAHQMKYCKASSCTA